MKNIKGFTLIDVIIIIVILGLLSAMAVPIYQVLTRESQWPEIKKQNEIILSSSGELVGKLPDGRWINHYEIGSESGRNHSVYVISDNSSLSVNYPVPSGKITRNETVVIINGKEYVEKNAD
jgi:type II secretory pathway pseudopilin PulG